VIQIKALNNLRFAQLTIEELRFFLSGPGQQMFPLHEVLGNDVVQVTCEFLNQEGKVDSVALGSDSLQPEGFSSDQTMLPFAEQSFFGYGLLLDYFTFPEKFLFFSLKGLDRIKARNPGNTIDIWFYLKKPIRANTLIGPGNFVINATPAVNLYSRVAEPIWIDRTKTEYQIVPDARRPQGAEIFTIDSVAATTNLGNSAVELHPFYSIRHHLGEDEGRQKAFWRAERRLSGRKGDEGTDVYISFTDWDLSPVDPGVETLTLNVTCTNRDLPSRLPFGTTEGDFEMELSAPIERTVCLVKPTATRRPALGAALQWRLISHLALNYLSISQDGENALRELLKLYDFDDSPATRQHISGILSLKSGYVTKRIGQSFCRGLQVTIEFDEDKYVGSGLFLFASVLERFLAQYVSINSFSQMIAKTIQRKELLRIWPPRNGSRVLL
jgi:type VI secretion system protein ImpG